MLFQTAVPLHDLILQDRSVFQLTDNVSLAPVPDWLRIFGGIKHLSASDKDAFFQCKYALIINHEAEEFIDPSNDVANTVRADLADQAYLANLALWLRPIYLAGFSFLFHARVDHGICTPLQEDPGRHDRFLYHPNDQYPERSPTLHELEPVRELYAALRLIPRNTAPCVACRALTSALQMNHREIRHLLLWVALESLFGTEGSEITFRLSQGLSYFISSDRTEAVEIFAKAKAGYITRCRIAHGDWKPTTNDYRKEASALVGVTESFVRRSLVKLLSDQEITKNFYGKARRNYLETLPFTKIWSLAAPNDNSPTHD